MSLWFRHCEMFKSDFSLRQSQTGFSTRCLTKHICCRMHRNYRWLTVKSIPVRVNWAILEQSLNRLVCRICSTTRGFHQIKLKSGNYSEPVSSKNSTAKWINFASYIKFPKICEMCYVIFQEYKLLKIKKYMSNISFFSYFIPILNKLSSKFVSCYFIKL